MSSKPAPDRRPWSLAARLTAWYAGASFAVVLLATGVLYWALAGTLDEEDDEFLIDKAREVRAVLARRPADPAALRQEVEAPPHQHIRMFARVVGPDGTVRAETPGMADPLPPAAFPPPAAEVGAGTDVRPAAGGLYRVVAVRAGDATVQVGMDRTQEGELLEVYRRTLLAVLVGAVALCGAAGYAIARRGLRPLRAIAATAGRVRPANLGERIETAGLPAELLALAATFNDMLARLEQSFARLGRFSADLAHELRTPVNNLRGGLEVALGRPRDPDEYRETLASSLEDCGRLTRLIDALLFLARAENPQTEVDREPVDVGAELAAVRAVYEPAAAEGGVRVAVDVPAPVRAELNRPLFQRAVGNLLANALAHTPAGGAVTLAAAGDAAGVTVTVADTGAGVPAAHLPHVFDRFYRADPARSSAGGNLGLGLAIVKGVAEMHGGSVAIASEAGRGTRVTLTFPRPPVVAARPALDTR